MRNTNGSYQSSINILNSDEDMAISQATYEQIRGSSILFVIKIAGLLILTNLIYMALNYVLLQAFFLNHELPFNLHDKTPVILTFVHIATTIFQVWGIVSIVLSWVGRSYQITPKHLIQRAGVMNCVEKFYDLNIIRSVSIQQSWLGKMFGYGNVYVEVSASGGYTDSAVLSDISNPQHIEKMLRKYF